MAERLRSHGITVAVGHRPENVAGRRGGDLLARPCQPENAELAEARARGIRVVPRSEMLAAICATRRCLAVAGHAREDDDGLHAVADPGRGGPAALLRHRGRRQRDRDQRRVGHRGVARRRGRRELRHLPGDPARPGRADQRRAGPSRLLRHLRRAARRLRRLRGRRPPGRGRVRRRPRGGGHRAASTAAITVGTDPGSTYVMARPRAAAQLGLLHPARARGRARARCASACPGLHNARNAAVAAVAALQAGAPVRGGPGRAGPLRRA